MYNMYVDKKTRSYQQLMCTITVSTSCNIYCIDIVLDINVNHFTTILVLGFMWFVSYLVYLIKQHYDYVT